MKLCPISTEFLYEGMLVDFGIHYCVGKSHILLCRDVILTMSMIEGIESRVSNEGNIYVEERYRDKILNDNAYFDKAQHLLEEASGYLDAKKAAKKFMREVKDGEMLIPREVIDLAIDVEDSLDKIDLATILQCINGIRKLDEYIYTHSLNVGILNGMMAKWLGFDEQERRKLVIIGLVHDLGKLLISPQILNKPGRLTDLEFEVIKRHPSISRKILEEAGEFDDEILDGAEQHHERQTGCGYPHGLGVDEISLYAKITAVSDVYDAMVAKRPYKDAQSPFSVLDELAQNAFSDLDLHITKTFLEFMPRELTHKQVLLSNGALARIEYVNPAKLRYPLVSVDGEIIETNEELYCVRMKCDLMEAEANIKVHQR